MQRSLAVYIGSRYASLRSGTLMVGFISGLTVIGLALGVAVLITVLSVMNGFDREMQQRILGLVPHITVTTPRLAPLRGETEWQPLRARLAESPGVTGTAPFLQLQGMLLANGHSKGILLNGIMPDEEREVSVLGDYIEAGSLSSLQPGDYNLVLGRTLAAALEVSVGDRVTLVSTVVPLTPLGDFTRQKSFTVSAIFSVGSQLDSTLAVVHLRDAQTLYRLEGRLHGYRVQTADLFSTGDVMAVLRQRLGDELDYGDWTTTYGPLYDNIRLSKTLVGLLLSLLVAVAAFNVVVSLMMVVREKRGDIAILRTMGAARSSVRNIFLVQGWLIGVIGTGAGVMLGILASLSVSHVVAWLQQVTGVQFLSADIYPVNYLPSELWLSDVLLVAGLSLLLSLLATLYPARQSALARPAEILRYE
ncbi:MAG: lipoprotein-releasing ABC transporter permease subunit [Pseudohongiellaceae bacterium]